MAVIKASRVRALTLRKYAFTFGQICSAEFRQERGRARGDAPGCRAGSVGPHAVMLMPASGFCTYSELPHEVGLHSEPVFPGIAITGSHIDRPCHKEREARGQAVCDVVVNDKLAAPGRVEVWCGGVGRAYPLAAPFGWRCLTGPTVLRLQTPLIEPDVRVSRIRLSEKASRFRPREVAAGARLKTRQAQHGVQVRVRKASRSRFRHPVLRTQPLA